IARLPKGRSVSCQRTKASKWSVSGRMGANLLNRREVGRLYEPLADFGKADGPNDCGKGPGGDRVPPPRPGAGPGGGLDGISIAVAGFSAAAVAVAVLIDLRNYHFEHSRLPCPLSHFTRCT